MTPEEVTELIDVCAAAYRQQADPRDQMIWSAAVGDLSFSLARRAVVEWIRTSPYWPRPADLRERARLIAAQDAREKAKRGQIEARSDAPVVAGRTGADMVRHVLGRLKDAGSDPEFGKYLGVQRCGDVAEEAVHEWLERTAQQKAFLRTQDGKPNQLYRPVADGLGTRCLKTEPHGRHDWKIDGDEFSCLGTFSATDRSDYYDTQATAGPSGEPLRTTAGCGYGHGEDCFCDQDVLDD